MQVRTCSNCPYAPADLGPHFSAHAEELCCIDCQLVHPVSNRVYPRRRKSPAVTGKPQSLGQAAGATRLEAVAAP